MKAKKFFTTLNLFTILPISTSNIKRESKSNIGREKKRTDERTYLCTFGSYILCIVYSFLSIIL